MRTQALVLLFLGGCGAGAGSAAVAPPAEHPGLPACAPLPKLAAYDMKARPTPPVVFDVSYFTLDPPVVDDPGAAPLARLKLAPRPGDWPTSISGGSMLAADALAREWLPIELRGRTTVDCGDTGATRLTTHVTGVEVREPRTPKTITVDAYRDGLTEGEISAERSPAGAIAAKRATFFKPGWSTAEDVDRAAGFDIPLVLPDSAVGLGARWHTTGKGDLLGVPGTIHVRAHLVALAPKLTVEAELELTGENPKHPAHGTGTGTYSVDPASGIPEHDTRVTLELVAGKMTISRAFHVLAPAR